jgi:uncharacterized membrane protein
VYVVYFNQQFYVFFYFGIQNKIVYRSRFVYGLKRGLFISGGVLYKCIMAYFYMSLDNTILCVFLYRDFLRIVVSMNEKRFTMFLGLTTTPRKTK